MDKRRKEEGFTRTAEVIFKYINHPTGGKEKEKKGGGRQKGGGGSSFLLS